MTYMNFPSGAEIVRGLIVLFIIGILSGYGLNWLFSSDEIVVKERLEPVRVELIIEDNKVDTVYIYKIP